MAYICVSNMCRDQHELIRSSMPTPQPDTMLMIKIYLSFNAIMLAFSIAQVHRSRQY